MTFNTALTSGQLTKVRSAYQGVDNVSFFSNRIVLQGQLGVDLSVGVIFASFAYGRVTVGAYTDVQVGQTVWVSPTSNIADWVWRGRVRLAPSSTTFYCNETEANWGGNFYLFVTDVWEVWDRLSRPDITTLPPVQKVDFDEAYHKEQPGITGLQYVYAGNKDTGTGKFRIALNLTSTAYESGATISSWLISPRSGQATLISGSYSSAVATFDLDPSTMPIWGETWFTVTVTDSNGNTLTRHCGVKIYDDTHVPDLAFKNIEISNDIGRGWSAHLPAFAGVDSILPWALVAIWRDQESYGGVAGNLGQLNNIDFIGYLRKDDPNVTADPKQTTISKTTFECLDVAGRMANIEMQQLGIQNGTNAVWDYINALTARRALWHCLVTHSTVATLVDVTFDSFLSDDSKYLFPDFSTQGNNLLSAFNGIGQQVNAQFEFGPDGSIEVNRDLRQTDAATRNAAVTVMSLQATGGTNGTRDDCKVIGSSRTYEPRIGVVDGNGANNAVPPVYQSRSPGLAQGIAQGRTTLANQVLDATGNPQTEINQRTGNEFEIQNAQETLTLEMPAGYNFGVASRAQWYTLVADTNLAGPNGVSRIIYTSSIRWQLEQVHYTIDSAKGTRKVQWTLRRESPIGLPGYSIVIPAQPSASIVPFGVVPPAFSIDPLGLPPGGVTVPPALPTPVVPISSTPTLDWTASTLWISTNFQGLVSPTRKNITPSGMGSFQIKQAIFDLADLTVLTAPIYLLASDGTNSAVWHTTNGLAAIPTWTKGANVSGVYTLVRLTQTPGSIEIYAPGGAGGLTYDFSISDQGFTAIPVAGYSIPSFGTYSGGAWNAVDGYALATPTNFSNDLFIRKLLGASYAVSSITIYFDRTQSTSPIGNEEVSIRGYLSGSLVFNQSAMPGSYGSGLTYAWTGSATIDEIQVDMNQGTTHSNPTGGIGKLTKVVGTFSSAFTALSTDFGATFASAVTVGASPGAVGGADWQHSGTVSFVAADKEIMKATTLGGSYSNFLSTSPQEPIVIELPWWKWGQGVSGTQNTGSTPDFCYGVDALISGAAFWLVVGSTATDCTPVISTVHGIPVGPNCITTWCGTHIAGLFKFSGVTHLMTGVITNSGTPAITWTDRGSFAATYIRVGYNSPFGPLYVAGDANEWYAGDFATFHTRTAPATSGVLGLEPAR